MGAEPAPGTVEEAAWAVYAVPPADFVATRTAWVKRLRGEGEKEAAREVGALRKPSVSAAAVNALVRAEDPVVDRLRDLGERLRHAQSALDAAGLTSLRGERDEVLQDWVSAARSHAPGGALTSAVEGEVRGTAVAALADAAASEVVLSGTLTRALSYSGFGEVDIADAVARTSTGVVLTRIQGGAGAVPGADAEQESLGGDDAGESEEDLPEGAGDALEADDAAQMEDDAAQMEDDAAEGGDHAAEGGDDTPDGEGQPHDDAEHQRHLEQLATELEGAEEQVSRAREARRAAADAAARADSRTEVARQGLEQARRLLEQAQQHADQADAAAASAQADLGRAETELDEARAARDEAREALEEAQDAI